MDMRVHNGLTSGDTDVHAYVEAIRAQFRPERRRRGFDSRQELGMLLIRHVEERRHVPYRDDQGMAG